MNKAKECFRDFLKRKQLKLTKQREIVLDTFLSTEQHVTVEDLYNKVKDKHPMVGQVTVFRTLKLLQEGGLAQEVYLGDKRIRYEHKYEHKKHIHLICFKCLKIIDIISDDIDELEKKISEENGFSSQSYRVDIIGTCSSCANEK